MTICVKDHHYIFSDSGKVEINSLGPDSLHRFHIHTKGRFRQNRFRQAVLVKRGVFDFQIVGNHHQHLKGQDILDIISQQSFQRLFIPVFQIVIPKQDCEKSIDIR